MFENLTIFKLASAMASHAGRRQALAAENMANVDTPGYKAKRLPSFSDVVGDSAPSSLENGFAMRATRPGHFGVGHTTGLDVRLETLRDMPAPDGNTSTVELEMLESVGAKREHDRALAIYKSGLNILHSSLGKR